LVGILAYNWIVTTALGMNKVLSMMSVVVAGQFLALTPICVPVVDRDLRRCGQRAMSSSASSSSSRDHPDPAQLILQPGNRLARHR
jgi:hypothetical protein